MTAKIPNFNFEIDRKLPTVPSQLMLDRFRTPPPFLLSEFKQGVAFMYKEVLGVDITPEFIVHETLDDNFPARSAAYHNPIEDKLGDILDQPELLEVVYDTFKKLPFSTIMKDLEGRVRYYQCWFDKCLYAHAIENSPDFLSQPLYKGLLPLLLNGSFVHFSEDLKTVHVVKNMGVGIADEVLHADGQGVYVFENGTYLDHYYLRGQKVDKYLATTTVEEIDIRKYKEYSKNVDVLAEFLHKAMPLLLDNAKIIDTYENYPDDYWITKSEYILYDLGPVYAKYKPKDVELGDDRQYHLKMNNLTRTGVVHLEAVSNECKTVKDALKFRVGLDEDFEIIGID